MTFSRVINNTDHYLAKLKLKPIDILLIDLGTNDLCNQSECPETVLQKVDQFLDLLESSGVTPKKVVFLSIIQRASDLRAGQVSLSTFNHRGQKFNRLLRGILGKYPNVFIHS